MCEKKYCLKCNDDTHDSTCEAFQQWKKENGMADDKFQVMDCRLLFSHPHLQPQPSPPPPTFTSNHHQPFHLHHHHPHFHPFSHLWSNHLNRPYTKKELIASGLLKLCPHCNVRTQKVDGTHITTSPLSLLLDLNFPSRSQGCNFMTCQLCHKAWCWQCGLTHEACPGGHGSHK